MNTLRTSSSCALSPRCTRDLSPLEPTHKQPHQVAPPHHRSDSHWERIWNRWTPTNPAPRTSDLVERYSADSIAPTETSTSRTTETTRSSRASSLRRSHSFDALPVPTTLFASPFAPLNDLTPTEQDVLRSAAKTFVGEAVSDWEKFIAAHPDRVPSPDDWKPLREARSTRVFVERCWLGHHSPEQDATTNLLGLGVMSGTIDEVLYGCVNASMDQARVRTAYCKDAMANGAVLASLEQPSMSEPFRSLSLRWGVHALPSALRTSLRHRDAVFLEATGYTELSSRERVGYLVQHTVDLPQIHVVQGCLRVEFSIVALWRQLSNRRVEIFIQATLDPLERLMGSALVRSVADEMLACSLFVHAAQMKKIACSLRHQTTQLASTESTCVSCKSSVKSLFQRRALTCELCQHALCSTCANKRVLFSIDHDERLAKYTVPLCGPCLRQTIAMDAAEVAMQELLDEQHVRGMAHLERDPSVQVRPRHTVPSGTRSSLLLDMEGASQECFASPSSSF